AQTGGALRRLRGRPGRGRSEEPRLRTPLSGRRSHPHRCGGQPGAWRARRATPSGARSRGAGRGRASRRSSEAEGRPAQAEGGSPPAEGSSNDLQERLARLEGQVQRAIELIGTLRSENARLTGDRRSLETRVVEVTAEAEGLRTRLGVITRLEMEQRRLL